MTVIKLPAPTLAEALRTVRTPQQQRHQASHAPARPPCPLNWNQQNVVKYLAAGYTQPRAAKAAGYSPNGVDGLMDRIYAKTGTRTTPEIVAVAVRNGWIK